LVDDDKSSAQIGNGAVLFRLQKQEAVIWEQLYSTDYGKYITPWQKSSSANLFIASSSEPVEDGNFIQPHSVH
jgi:hypothetical protein